MLKILSKILATLTYTKKRQIFLFCSVFVVIVIISYLSLDAYWERGSEDNIRYYRDVYTQDSWPEMDTKLTRPGDIPFTAHYYWCDKKVFRFEDYIGMLSIIRVLKPQKIIFHYTNLPIVDSYWYHTWFQELKQSVPNLVLRSNSKSFNCGSKELIRFILEQISDEGGVYVGEKTIITRVPKEAWSSDFYASFGNSNDARSDITKGVIYSKSGFPTHTINSKIEQIRKQKSGCLTVKEFVDNSGKKPSGAKSGKGFPPGECIVVKESFYPKDIWNSTTSFGELSRWLFYGKRKRFQVKPDPEGTPLIPMISHMVWMRTNNILKTNEFKFLHYLSVLSAIHVAGFERVYIHGEVSPYGKWWDALKKRDEKVTFIKIERPETVFQQKVVGPSHQSDVLRLNSLLRHGGAYQDRDVIWVNKIPRDVRRYQAVACADWPRNGAWPEVFNMGVMMAKPGAEWLKHFLQTFSYYRDDKWAFNAVMMPYKAYELHPDTLHVDRHLQVICFRGICHPAWHDDYIRDIDDVTPVRPFDWRDAKSFHFTKPKPPKSLVSPRAIRKGKDMFAEMGRMILEKSGREDLLK